MPNALLTRLLADAEQIETQIDEITRAAAESDTGDLTDAQQANIDELRGQHEQLVARAADLRAFDERAEQAAAIRTAVGEPAATGATVTRSSIGERLAGGVRVTSEPEVYRAGSDENFLVDAYRAVMLRDSQAGDRITRNQRQVLDMDIYRDVNTSAVSGLVLPQYLTEMVAPLRRARSPFADICTKHLLPKKGMNCYISRITTGGAMDVQAAEGDAVDNSPEVDDTLLTIPVRTIAGRQRATRQALDRGEGIDDLLIQDAALNYSTTLDNQLINGAGTSGTHLGLRNTVGINAVTYTDASPTVPEFWPKLVKALIVDTGENVFESATDLLMRARRFGWLAAATDSAGRPLLVPTPGAAQNPLVSGAGIPQYGMTGYSALGAGITTDGNIPGNLGAGTDEDIVLAVNRTELHLWEDPAMPLQLRFEDVNTLKVDIVLFAYSAFTAGRYPAAHSVISGTGLIAPTF